jgi:hypothetical protein
MSPHAPQTRFYVNAMMNLGMSQPSMQHNQPPIQPPAYDAAVSDAQRRAVLDAMWQSFTLGALWMSGGKT